MKKRMVSGKNISRKMISNMAAGLLAALFVFSGACMAYAGPEQTVPVAAYQYGASFHPPAAARYGDLGSQRAIGQNNTMSDEFRRGLQSFSCRTASALLKDSSENRVYSPASLYYSLALAAQSAGGSTGNQLYGLLTVPGQNTDQMASECGSLFRLMYRDNEVSHIKVANSMWLREGAPLADAFRRLVEQQYYSDILRINFADPGCAGAMNHWCAGRTGQGLTVLPTVSPDESMRLTGAVQYSNEWVFNFDRTKNENRSFYKADGQTVTCEYMTDLRSTSWYRGQGFLKAAISLKENSSITFILPDEGVTPQSLLASEERMNEMFGYVSESYGPVSWSIPKFHCNASLDLRPMLEGLGVADAFYPDRADFTGLTGEAFHISNISQDLRISIDENGVNANTYSVIEPIGSSISEPAAEMNLNRPFIYAVQGAPGIIMYIGICANPAA